MAALLEIWCEDHTINWCEAAVWWLVGFVFGIMGDRWGRAKTMLLTILICSAFTGLSALLVIWVDFTFYRFLTGLGVGGEFAAGVALHPF